MERVSLYGEGVVVCRGCRCREKPLVIGMTISEIEILSTKTHLGQAVQLSSMKSD